MKEKRWLYFALGVTTVISVGAVANQLIPLATTGVALSEQGITFPDGTVQTTAAPHDPRRAFYLTTTTTYDGATADGSDGDGAGVCARGYHFASLFEILDVTNLRYDSNLGLPVADSGHGPPSALFGWVRTGYETSGAQTDSMSLGDGGFVNCDAWTTAASDRDGTIAALNWCWQEEADCLQFVEYALSQWWIARDDECSNMLPVWCVENYPGAAG